jgi:hypothetical protein
MIKFYWTIKKITTFDNNDAHFMKSQRHLISTLTPQLFWDVDISRLTDHKASRLIIERVFTMGNMNEINRVILFYGERMVIDVLCGLSYLDSKTFNFIKKYFNIPDTEFRCHHLQQSRPGYWNS